MFFPTSTFANKSYELLTSPKTGNLDYLYMYKPENILSNDLNCKEYYDSDQRKYSCTVTNRYEYDDKVMFAIPNDGVSFWSSAQKQYPGYFVDGLFMNTSFTVH